MPVAFLMVAALAACPIEHARYALRTQSAVTASFIRVDSGHDWPSGLAFGIDLEGRRLWFLPWPGGSDGEQNLASTLDPTRPGWAPPNPDGGPRPLGNFQYLGFDETYRLLSNIPLRGGRAPAHILLPNLDDGLRHPPGDQPRMSLARQFFDRVSCGR